MRTEIFNPKNFQISLRTNKRQDKIYLNILDQRLPAGTLVDAEETSTFGMTPMYYSEGECITSAVYLAQIVEYTLWMTHNDDYTFESHVYTAYTILHNRINEAYWRDHSVQVHNGVVPANWSRCHAKEFADYYNCAEQAINCLLNDLQNQTFGKWKDGDGYFLPTSVQMDCNQNKRKEEESLDSVWMRLRQMSDPDAIAGMRELNQMVGMSAVKNYIQQLVCNVQLRKMRGLMGLRAETKTPMHFVFTGNPGTGKTTAAKALGKALHEAGIISRGDVVYRDRSTLVGPHVGDSENCVRELFEKEAPGNVVVIDEAYTLTADNWKGDFGHRVVDSLMTYTADPDADFVVVLCGYREEMNRMLSTNPGLSSRFSLRFDFVDFSINELMEITHRSLSEMDYHFTPEAEAVYSEVLREVLNSHQPHFGNARWVKSAIHQHILEALHRRQTQCLTRGAVQLSREFFSAIERIDVEAVADQLRHLNTTQLAQRRIGFAA